MKTLVGLLAKSAERYTDNPYILEKRSDWYVVPTFKHELKGLETIILPDPEESYATEVRNIVNQLNIDAVRRIPGVN